MGQGSSSVLVGYFRQVANAVLLFIFIPVFETLVYPLFHKCNLLKRPLQKMCVGGVLATLSFTAAGIVETNIHVSQERFVVVNYDCS